MSSFSHFAKSLEHGFNFGHGLQLVGDPFQPVVSGLDHASHFSHLPTNHRVLDQGLAESLALASLDPRQKETLEMINREAKKHDKNNSYSMCSVSVAKAY